MTDYPVIHVKNMVCPRCITAVEKILSELQIDARTVQLGEVMLNSGLEEKKTLQLKAALEAQGFELLERGKSALISQIKALIIQQLRDNQVEMKSNFSTYLAEKLHREYTYLSRLFSATEGITIEKFITSQKIERVKELLFYDQLSLSEIAFQMDYSTVAYLSAQFKKETGMTPSEFKKQNQPGHRALDSL